MLRRQRRPEPQKAKPLEVERWEALLAIPLVLVALVFLFAREWVSAIVLIAVSAIALTWRVQIVERNVAGGYARVRGWLLITQWVAMGAIYVIIVGVLWIGSRDHWTRTRPGLVAVFASGGLAFFLAREMMRRGDEALNYLAGGDAEVRVAAVLDGFRDRGWDVIHDVKKDFGGNVDHLVLAPNVAFAIETKSGRESARGRGQAMGGAAWAKEKYGRTWVNAVLCVESEPPVAPKKVGHAWVTSVDDLHALIDRMSRR
jgi:Nuclease-related domain